MNNQMGESNFDMKYFDKRVPDEDSPINVEDEKQESYQRLDAFFERIFDENSLNVAKVNKILLLLSNHQKRKEIKKH